MREKTIHFVTEKGLCTGCGTCVAVCPSSAIHLSRNYSKGIYVPKINFEECKSCGLCYQVCSGYSVDFEQLNQAIFCKKPENILIGNYLKCYVGYATDCNIRYNSSSGGLITVLLIFALETGLINGALVTRMSEKNPLEPQPFIARTREDIISASKSKYCPVPANIALKEILQNEGKFAVVGLPCQIHGIRKAEATNKELKSKIALHMGLFCSYNISFLGTEFWLDKLCIAKDQVKTLNYRGEGWPGGMLIELKNGNMKFIPSSTYWGYLFNLFFYAQRCCLFCSDQASELADLSFGDAWLPELADDKIGTSIIVSRSKLGDAHLQQAVIKGKIKLSPISVQKVVYSQLSALYSKKKNLNARAGLYQIRGSTNVGYFRLDLLDYLIALFIILDVSLSSRQFLNLFLKAAPFKIIGLYRRFLEIMLKKAQNNFIEICMAEGRL